MATTTGLGPLARVLGVAILVAGAFVGCGPAPSTASAPAPAAGGTSTDVPAAVVPSAPVPADAAVLLAGMRLDLQGRCAPLATGLPEGAIAGVRCVPGDPAAVDAASVYLFDTGPAMLTAYGAWLEANSLSIRDASAGCIQGASAEAAYVPGDDRGELLHERAACVVGADGRARGAVTMPPFALATFEGPVADLDEDPAAVARWAFLGNRDQPGGPTVWNAGGPMSPEK
jgi:hypothetical protein